MHDINHGSQSGIFKSVKDSKMLTNHEPIRALLTEKIFQCKAHSNQQLKNATWY